MLIYAGRNVIKKTFFIKEDRESYAKLVVKQAKSNRDTEEHIVDVTSPLPH